jgi:multiple sugar transport system substrate-binding protein
VTITYWGLWENEAQLTGVIAEYKKTHPNIEVVYSKQSPKQYRERLQNALARGEGPDLFRFHNTWVPMLQADLAPAGPTGYSSSDFQQTFYPVANADLVIGGRVYGAPLMFDGLGLYYNEDLLRAAGVTPPTTWEEFRQAALTLTVKNETGAIVTAGAALGTATNIEHFSDILAVMMLQNGADLKHPAAKEAQDALSFYRLFAERPNNVWDETLDNSILAFANGRVAFIFAPSWQVMAVRQINPNLKFQVIPIPQLPGTNVTWASYWVEGVSSKSKHQAEAWEFLKYLTSKETMVALYTEVTKDPTRPFGEPYSRIDLAQTIINDPYVGAYVRQAQTAQSFFLASKTYDNGINDLMIKYLEDAVNSLNKGVSVDAALQTAAQGFTQVLKIGRAHV